MKIDSMMTSPGADVYYTDEFRNIIEDHITFLKEHPQTYTQAVSSFQAYKFEGDFFGLLEELNYQKQIHWIIMRMNDLTSPVYTTEDIISIIIPSSEVIERIRSVYMNINKIKN